MSRLLIPIFGALLLLAFANPAAAQIQVVRSPATAPVLGNVVKGSTTTRFQVSPTGGVTRLSGDAIRLSSLSVTAPTITLSCGLLGLNQICALRRVRVTITATGRSADASIVSFRVANISTGLLGVAVQPVDGPTVTFELYPFGIGTVSFNLGMTIQLSPGAASGVETFDYTVTAQVV